LDNNLKEKIEFFFMDPSIDPNSLKPKYSILYLLRRDICTCLKIDPTTKKVINYQARWPGIMTIMSGIDLLAQYLEGNDCIESTGRRFKKYIKKFFKKTNSKERNVLFQLRNALIHSFGLYARDSEGNEYNFTLTSIEKSKLLEFGEKDYYIVGDKPLHREFEKSLEAYHNILLEDTSLQKNFESLFPHYSTMNTMNIT